MKAISLLSLLVLLTPLTAQTPAPATATPEPAAAAKVELLPNQKAFLNLPEESRKKFIKHLMEANRIFQQKRIIETFDELDKAAAIFKDSPELYNLRGSCYVELRAFDKALAEFLKAIELAKDNPNIEFNIGEVYFVTQQWQKSIAIFQKVLKPISVGNFALGRLVEFKILLCMKKLGQKDEAAALAGKYDDLDDSPYYYYAQAAAAYDAGDAPKAEEWLARAGRVFQNPSVIAPWKDTFIEYGYINGLYGGEKLADEPKK